MSLSKLLEYRDKINSLSTKPLAGSVSRELSAIITDIDSQEFKFGDVSDNLTMINGNIQEYFSQFDHSLDKLKQIIEANIKVWEPTYLQRSREMYQNILQNNAPAVGGGNERLAISSEIENRINARLSLYNDWHHAGAVLHPGQEPWVQQLVALDPLYLIDTSHEYLNDCLESFTSEYRNRVRCYRINENTTGNRDEGTTGTGFSINIPERHMSMILAYNFFTRKPINQIYRYLEWLHCLLKEGGTLIFTFNNCDRPSAVDLVERNCACFTPPAMIYSKLVNQGFEIVYTHDIDDANTWVEAKKPGKLTSMRGGQSLARPVAKSFDLQ